uniref:Uncharacterized protein n=1 Tax=Siphoviridae sp. ctZHD14 TaxID=2827891 RepID=A0A8S5SWW8_9CAUD|nr:MAG TPA: hypothetical protein [Siphoviridae sp. ctZHD14]
MSFFKWWTFDTICFFKWWTYLYRYYIDTIYIDTRITKITDVHDLKNF